MLLLVLTLHGLRTAVCCGQATIVYGQLVNPHPQNPPPGWDDSGFPMFSTLSGTLVLDFNGDGQPDVGFADDDMSFYIYGFAATRVLTYPPAGLDINSFLPVLAAGTEIGAASQNTNLIWRKTLELVPSGLYSATYNGVIDIGNPSMAYSGYWQGVEGYTGVEFYIGTELHYAWIRVGVPFIGANGGYVRDYAYETRPNTPIKAGAKPVPVPLALPQVVRPGYLRLQWPSEMFEVSN